MKQYFKKIMKKKTFPKREDLNENESPLEMEIICSQNGALNFQFLV